jgi:hypothetical protein
MGLNPARVLITFEPIEVRGRLTKILHKKPALDFLLKCVVIEDCFSEFNLEIKLNFIKKFAKK